MLLRSHHPEAVHVALVSAGTAAILPRLLICPLIAMQAAMAAVHLESGWMAAAAILAAVLAIPRTVLLAMWHRRRATIDTGEKARRWELLLAATGLPFSLSVGLMAAASLPFAETSWDSVECLIAVGYASAMTVSIGFRPNISSMHIILAVGPAFVGSLFAAELPQLTLAVMTVLLILVLRSNSQIVSEAVVSSTTLQHEAYLSARSDALTGLPNRRAFDERLAAPATSDALALLLIDLDGFKSVNDGFGHQAGDVLLAEIGSRLRRWTSDGREAYRLGGDEFALFVKPVEAEALAETLVAACRVPVLHEGIVLTVGASIGIAIGAADRLLQCADAALYAAKRQGRNCWRSAPLPDAERLAA